VSVGADGKIGPFVLDSKRSEKSGRFLFLIGRIAIPHESNRLRIKRGESRESPSGVVLLCVETSPTNMHKNPKFWLLIGGVVVLTLAYGDRIPVLPALARKLPGSRA